MPQPQGDYTQVFIPKINDFVNYPSSMSQEDIDTAIRNEYYKEEYPSGPAPQELEPQRPPLTSGVPGPEQLPRPPGPEGQLTAHEPTGAVPTPPVSQYFPKEPSTPDYLEGQTAGFGATVAPTTDFGRKVAEIPHEVAKAVIRKTADTMGDLTGTLPQIMANKIVDVLEVPKEAPLKAELEFKEPEMVGTWASKAVDRFSKKITGKIERGWENLGKKFAKAEDLNGRILDHPELLSDPRWLPVAITELLPSAAVAYGAGRLGLKTVQVGGMKLKLGQEMLRKLAYLGGVITGGTAGAGLEMSGTYKEALRRGMSEDQAMKAAEKMFYGSAALNSLSMGIILFPRLKEMATKYLVPRLVGAGLAEAVTEGLEEPWEGVALGESLKQIKTRFGDAIDVAIPSLFVGGGTAAYEAHAVKKNKERLEELHRRLLAEEMGILMEEDVGEEDEAGFRRIKPTEEVEDENIIKSSEVQEQKVLWENVSRKVVQNVGSKDPIEIIKHYKKKYGMDTISFEYGQPTVIKKGYYRAAEVGGWTNDKGKYWHEIIVRPEWKGTKAEPGILRHELEHIKDREEGFVSTEEERHFRYYEKFEKEYPEPVQEKPQKALQLKDGKIIHSSEAVNYVDLVEQNNIDFDDVKSTGWWAQDKYTTDMREISKWMSEIAEEKKPVGPEPIHIYRSRKTGLGRDYSGSTHFTTDKTVAEMYEQKAKKPGIIEFVLKPKAKLWNVVKQGSFEKEFGGSGRTAVSKAYERGYVGINKGNDEIIIFDKARVEGRAVDYPESVIIEEREKAEPKPEEGATLDEILNRGIKKAKEEEVKKGEAGWIGKRPEPTHKPYILPKNSEKEFNESKRQGDPLNAVLKRAFNKVKQQSYRLVREFEYIPRTGEIAEEVADLRMKLITLHKQRGMQQERTLKYLDGITSVLDPEMFDTFTKKVVLDNVAWMAKDLDPNDSVQFNLTAKQAIEEQKRIAEYVKNIPEIMEALRLRDEVWEAIRNEYAKAMESIGIEGARDIFSNPYYFRQQTLEEAMIIEVQTQGRLKSKIQVPKPGSRSFGKKRGKRFLNFNTDYIGPEYEVISQMLYDVQMAEVIKLIDDKYNKIDDFRKAADIQNNTALLDKFGGDESKFRNLLKLGPRAKLETTEKSRKIVQKELGKDYVTWKDIVKRDPDYTIIHPQASTIFYKATTISDRMTESIMDNALDTLELDASMIRGAMAVGGKRNGWVLRTEYVKQLETMMPNVNRTRDKLIPELWQKGHVKWKQWILGSPWRIFKYSIRNLTGDLDISIAGNARGLRHVPRAISELFGVIYRGETPSLELQQWLDRGGFGTTLRAQEIGAISKAKRFDMLFRKKRFLPLRIWRGWWDHVQMGNDFRESILRYSHFLSYYKNMKKVDGKWKPHNYGASIPEEIDGLSDRWDKAFWLSNDLIGAYDRISETGKTLRRYWAPFWSFKEINMRRYVRLFKNTRGNDDDYVRFGMAVMKLLGLGGFRVSQWILTKVAQKFLLMLALTSGTFALNKLTQAMSGQDIESKLPIQVKNSSHLTFPILIGGQPKYFTRVGSLVDLLEWANFDNIIGTTHEWLSGRRTTKDVIKETALAPINTVLQSTSPVIKAGYELLSGKEVFPDIFKRRAVKDQFLQMAKSLGLQNEYKAVMGLPMRSSWPVTLLEAFYYTSDPHENAYSNTLNRAHNYAEKIGKPTGGAWNDEKMIAIYNAKLALRYGDMDAFDRYIKKYYAHKGTNEGLERILNNMMPLYMLSEEKGERHDFVATLSRDEQIELVKAFEFYEQVILESNFNKRKGE